jgi:excisionase family DNA binding protein
MMPDSMADGLMRVPEVARFLGLSRSTVYGLMDSGDMGYIKIGKSRRVHRSELFRLIERHRVPSRDEQADSHA